MSVTPQRLRGFLEGAREVILVEITRALGSTPRDAGAWMLVSAGDRLGTIGGGQLEFRAIDHAHLMLADAVDADTLDIPLGPNIGQCCGGRVEIALRRLDDPGAMALLAQVEADFSGRPHIYVFGAGHVGNALGQAFSLLPFRTLVVDTRGEEIDRVPEGVEKALVAVPEALVRQAPAGSAFVILTHDHGLDFLLAREALERRDAAYVGMIGSRTKRATFKSWLRDMEGDLALMDRLISPIGGEAVRDKRPEVIAALAVAEIVWAITLHRGAETG